MINAIVAVDDNFGIGYKNNLLIHIPEDLKNFKTLTSNKIVVMGRKTYESLPKRPLPNRINIVITNRKKESLEKNVLFLNLMETITCINFLKNTCEIFVIGGSSIYQQLLSYCDQIYLTQIFTKYKNVDSFFPRVDLDKNWHRETLSEVKEYQHSLYQFQLYKRL